MSDETATPNEQALVPVREQTVDFYGDTLVAAEGPDATIYVPLRTICDYLGLSWAGQRERALRHPVLGPALTVVRVTRTTATGGVPAMLCLPLDLLPGWLFGISAERVKSELREKIIRYQAECFQVLWRAFKADIVATTPPPPIPNLSSAEVAVEIAGAVYTLAQQQLALERALAAEAAARADLATRHQVMADYLRGYILQNEQRVGVLELRLSEGATISEAEAAEVALNVKAVAHALEQKGTANGYQRVYSEMYRRYRVSSYKNLPRARYQEVLAWLAEWAQELEGPGRDDGPPGR